LGWLVLSQNRDWVECEATICGRNAFRESSVEDGITSYEYFAHFEYCYGRHGRVFVGDFQEASGQNHRALSSFEEAVSQARRLPVGERISVVVDKQDPSLSAHRRPGGLWWPMLGIFVYVVFFAVLISAFPLILVISGPLLLLLASQQARAPQAEELPLECNPEPYLKILQRYPDLNYIPQKHIRKFDSLEKLLQIWGRPDSLWVDQGQRGLILHLVYREGSEWKESWEFAFALHGDKAPTPLSAPEKRE